MAEKHHIFSRDFEELLEACVSFYKRNKNKKSFEGVCEKRAKVVDYIDVFHKMCGTLTPSVKRRMEDLRNERCIILMTAHQPNFFAYSGVFRKATLNFTLAKKLERLLKVPVVNFFGIADQDFADDRWVRSCQLPSVQRSAGILSIEVKLPEKLMLNRVDGPSLDLLEKWKAEVEKWLVETIRSVNRLCKEQGFEQLSSTYSESPLLNNFEFFWDIVEDCRERSDKFSDFSAFIMSKIVNDVWGYDTVFARFSECQQVFVDEFAFLLSHSEKYSKLLKEAKEMPHEEGLEGGVSDQEPWLAPFWYHCDCGSKVKLFLTEKDGTLFGTGNCTRCAKHHDLRFGPKENPKPRMLDIASRISARAIPMCLVFFKGLLPSCYVGGVGGIDYLTEAEHVAIGLDIPFPPIALWRPHDKYMGIAQVEALLELKRICKDLGVQDLSTARSLLESRVSEIHGCLDKLESKKQRILEESGKNPNDEKLKEEIKKISLSQTGITRSSDLSVISHELKILENFSTVFDLIPSIVDYAVNIGLEETSSQWIRYLSENGSLCSDIRLESVLSRDTLVRTLS